MITNNANLFINDCEFNNIKVTSSKGVIQNIKTAKITYYNPFLHTSELTSVNFVIYLLLSPSVILKKWFVYFDQDKFLEM